MNGFLTCKQGWEVEIAFAQTHGGKSFCKFPRDERMFFFFPLPCHPLSSPAVKHPQPPNLNKSCDTDLRLEAGNDHVYSGLLWELLRLGLHAPLDQCLWKDISGLSKRLHSRGVI